MSDPPFYRLEVTQFRARYDENETERDGRLLLLVIDWPFIPRAGEGFSAGGLQGRVEHVRHIGEDRFLCRHLKTEVSLRHRPFEDGEEITCVAADDTPAWPVVRLPSITRDQLEEDR